MIDLAISFSIPPEIAALPQTIETATRGAMQAAGSEVKLGLQEHFMALNRRPNRHGWPKRGFWGEIMGAVGSNETDEAYEITIADPRFWRRWLGGEAITPKTGPKKLAIPAIAEAYAAGRPAAGRVPVELAVAVRWKDGKLQGVGLDEVTGTHPSRRDPSKQVKETGRRWYFLVAASNPPPDPEAVPDESTLEVAAQTAADGFIDRALAQMGQGGVA